jgi:hypothetical protein
MSADAAANDHGEPTHFAELEANCRNLSLKPPSLFTKYDTPWRAFHKCPRIYGGGTRQNFGSPTLFEAPFFLRTAIAEQTPSLPEARDCALVRGARKVVMENLTSYLNDHLSGSVAALELLDRLVETYEDESRRGFFRELRNEIAADQETLKALIQQLDAKESAGRKAGAWIVEKLSRTKIHLEDSPEGDMGLFLALEALVLGITGKQSLWRALAASQSIPPSPLVDYARLEERAVQQRDRIEAKRLKVAREVLQPCSDATLEVRGE